MIEGVDTERVSVHAIQTTHRGANVNMSVGHQVGPVSARHFSARH